jgi:hypothetical protein
MSTDAEFVSYGFALVGQFPAYRPKFLLCRFLLLQGTCAEGLGAFAAITVNRDGL